MFLVSAENGAGVNKKKNITYDPLFTQALNLDTIIHSHIHALANVPKAISIYILLEVLNNEKFFLAILVLEGYCVKGDERCYP